ncbi:hypothetical protein ACFCT7_15420 [Fulvivirgaceae bacterium LMO-SS25]
MKNNKSMSMILSIILLMSTTFSLQAQESESLKRDMEVTSNLLSSLLKTNTRNSFAIARIGTDGIETSYNEGFGVVFDLQGGGFVFLNAGQYVTLRTQTSGANVNFEEIEELDRRVAGKALSVTSGNNGSTSTENVLGTTSFWSENNNKDQEEKTDESIREFLIEYGSFLKDLKPDEKIVVQYPFVKMETEGKGTRDNVAIWSFNSTNKATRSFSITKKDADAYRNGSITKEEALSRITVEENLPEEVATDLRVLGELMNSLYSERNSKTYFSTTNPTIVKTKGMGAIYSWAVYSAYNDSFGYRLPTLSMGAETVDEKNRNELVKAAYPNFLKSFKENLVDYGRTVKSLEGNEKIVFNIRMTKCDGCGIPNMLKVEMDRATIEDYNQGKLSRSQAITKLKVIEN